MTTLKTESDSYRGTASDLRDIPWPAAIGVLVFVVLALFVDLFFSGSASVISHPRTDLASYFIFVREFGFRELSQGNLALWNPHILSGTPFFGGFQSALLYPPNWIYLLLPLGSALNLEVAGHLFVLGAFTLLWAREQSGSWMGGLIAALIAMLGGANYLHVYGGHLGMLDATAWMPLLFIAVDRIILRHSLASAWIGTLAITMQIHAGHPQTVYATALAASAYFLLQLWRSPNKKKSCLWALSIYPAALALGAWQLIAAFAASAESTRGGALPYADSASFSLPWINLITLAAPWFLGKNPEGESLSGGVYVGEYYMWEMVVYVGAAGVFLAAVGLFQSRGRYRWVVGALATLFLILALGENTPLHRLLHFALPGFDRFRGSCKFTSQATMFIAMLAALGWKSLVNERRLSVHAMSAITAAVLFMFAGVIIFLSGRTDSGIWARVLDSISTSGHSFVNPERFSDPALVSASASQAARSACGAGVAFGVIGVALAWRNRSRFAICLLPLLLALELFFFARGARPSFELKPTLHPPELLSIRDQLEHGERVLTRGGLENAMMSNGMLSIWGYDPQVSRRYAEWMFFTQGLNPNDASYELSIKRLTPAHQLMRCARGLIQDNNASALRGIKPTLPQAFLVSDWEVLKGRDEILSRSADAGFDPMKKAFLENDPGINPNSGEGSGQVQIVPSKSNATDTIMCEVETDSSALLVFTSSYSSGWRARAVEGGERYSVLPVNHVQLGVALAPGKHHIKLEYAPTGITFGKCMTLSTLALFLAAGVLIARRRFSRQVAA